jgi:hypothetical protein
LVGLFQEPCQAALQIAPGRQPLTARRHGSTSPVVTSTLIGTLSSVRPQSPHDHLHPFHLALNNATIDLRGATLLLIINTIASQVIQPAGLSRLIEQHGFRPCSSPTPRLGCHQLTAARGTSWISSGFINFLSLPRTHRPISQCPAALPIYSR